jgi:hypothetical protein
VGVTVSERLGKSSDELAKRLVVLPEVGQWQPDLGPMPWLLGIPLAVSARNTPKPEHARTLMQTQR